MADYIEKKILLRAPKERVWRALSDSAEFGTWFGMRFDGPFVAGTAISGMIVPTSVDPEVAKAQKPYEGRSFQLHIEEIDPERRFAFRWHPGAVDPDVDYSAEPTTLVVFEMEETADGVLLTVRESGFDDIPLSRRAQAFSANEGGWTMVMRLIEKYVRDDS